mgnify:CR=1 FL=1
MTEEEIRRAEQRGAAAKEMAEIKRRVEGLETKMWGAIVAILATVLTPILEILRAIGGGGR